MSMSNGLDISTDPGTYMNQISQQQQAQISQIANETQAQLAILQQKYSLTDKIGSSVNIIAIVSVAMIYLLAVVSDLMNVCPSFFTSFTKKKIDLKVPGAKKKKAAPNKDPQEINPNDRQLIRTYNNYFYNVEIQLFEAMIKKKQTGKKYRVRQF